MLKILGTRIAILGVVFGLVIFLLGRWATGEELNSLLSNSKDFSENLAALNTQQVGVVWTNPIKHAIRNALSLGIPVETLTLLLLLPAVAAFIAAARHLIGLRGFGIFLPAALSAVFVEVGPVIGIVLFLLIVVISTWVRIFLRKRKVKLQYLPRMALILWAVVLSVFTFLALVPKGINLTAVSLLPVLILVLLSEDFTRVQLGKSIKVAISLTSETLVLALVSFGIFSFSKLRVFALLNPEFLLLAVLVFILFLGKYSGLRLSELLRFRRLLKV